MGTEAAQFLFWDICFEFRHCIFAVYLLGKNKETFSFQMLPTGWDQDLMHNTGFVLHLFLNYAFLVRIEHLAPIKRTSPGGIQFIKTSIFEEMGCNKLFMF
jgi:hypothetical protein